MSRPSKKDIQEYVEENRLLAAFHRAEAALHDNTAREAAAGITHETEEYLRLNQAAIEAGRRLPKRFRHLAEGV
ncbi:hypothetical protein [Streptomyces achromogenes]|uniref:hypothetical protein n=1 Tax=Streptomyces achromogenes TaxID=67255 RepID=UPI00342D634D